MKSKSIKKRTAKSAGTPRTENTVKKSDITRDRIVTAAKKVFARLPYHSASMRMIGKQGGFNHELIRYHFPNKAGLFQTILRDICDDFYRSNIAFLDGLSGLDEKDGLSLYIDRFIAHHVRNPEALRIIVLNMVMTDKPKNIPGYRHIPEMLSRTRRTFKGKVPVIASDKDIEIFTSSFNNLILHLLGAGYCQASILGLKHTGIKYREWVKTSLLEIFLPHLQRLIGAP
jgi:AcrR family transcriptional regulator